MQYNSVVDVVGQETLLVMREAGWYNGWLFSVIKPYLGRSVLEVGAGIGNFTKLLTHAVPEVYAIDIGENYLKKLPKLGYKNLKVGFGDIERGKYFFKNKKFDTLVCMNVLEHIKRDQKALGEMFALLKPGGKLILLVPAHQIAFGTLDFHLGHYRRYSAGKLTAKLATEGFAIETMRSLNFLGIFGWFLNARILRRKILPKYQLGIFDKIARPILILEKAVRFPIGLSLLAIASKK